MFKIIRLLIVLSFILNEVTVRAQATSVSPYSRNALGEFNPGINARSAAMGGLRVAQFNTLFFNIDNAASLSRLEYTTFDFGASQSIYSQQANSSDQAVQNFSTNISHMKIAIPLYKKTSMAFGFAPYSFVGYSVSDSDVGEGQKPQVNYSYAGIGGYNQAFFAIGSEIYKGLSLGVTGRYLFGDKEQINMVMPQLSGQRLYRREVINTRLQGLILDYGLGYTYKFSGGKELILGAKYRPSTPINSIYQRSTFSFVPANAAGTTGQALDTIENIRHTDALTTLPSEWAAGITLGKMGTVHPMHVWTAGLEVRRYNGSEYNYQYAADPLVNSTYIGAGASLLPKYAFTKFERSTNYFSRMEYRIGAFHETGFLQIQNNSITTSGMTFGFSLPLRMRGLAPGEAKFNHLNFSVTAAQRGTLNNDLIRERFVQFNFGVTLNDKWFIKYKYR